MNGLSSTPSKIDFQQLRVIFPKGKVIFAEGEARDNAYIIERGKVEISTVRAGKKVPLVELGEGEVFGEAALVGEGPRTATAIAVEDTEVFLISPALLRDRVTKLDPLVGLLMSLLVSRYRQWRHKSTDEVADPGRGPPGEHTAPTLADRADAFMRDLSARKEIALSELRMAQEIAQAISLNQFEAHLQPIVSLPDQQVMGFESLIRWRHPQRGMISPIDFIPVAERTNVIWDLDMLMLREACRLAPVLQQAVGDIGRKIYVSVNLSGVHFDDDKVIADIKGILDQSGTDPAHIVLEITESALVGDPAAAQRILEKLEAMGFRIALDDFGTGYSSLSYLHRFSIDILKIDRSFVRDIHKNKRAIAIVRAIANLAKTFDLDIVAEGIEADDEIFALSGLGCDCGQGYFFSKPLPADQAVAFLKDSVQKNG